MAGDVRVRFHQQGERQDDQDGADRRDNQRSLQCGPPAVQRPAEVERHEERDEQDIGRMHQQGEGDPGPEGDALALPGEPGGDEADKGRLAELAAVAAEEDGGRQGQGRGGGGRRQGAADHRPGGDEGQRDGQQPGDGRRQPEPRRSGRSPAGRGPAWRRRAGSGYCPRSSGPRTTRRRAAGRSGARSTPRRRSRAASDSRQKNRSQSAAAPTAATAAATAAIRTRSVRGIGIGIVATLADRSAAGRFPPGRRRSAETLPQPPPRAQGRPAAGCD